MFRRLVDTNILFDAWTKNINNTKAIQIIDEPICLLEGVLYELSNLLKNTMGTDYSCKVANEILDNPHIFKILAVSSEEQKQALVIMQKYQLNEPKKDYSLVDALQFIIAEKEGLILYTLDERMTYFDSNKVKIVKPY